MPDPTVNHVSAGALGVSASGEVVGHVITRRHRAGGLIGVGLALIVIGVIVALAIVGSGSADGDPSAVPNEQPRDSTLILVALIGAIPGTITAATGLVLALHAGKREAKPTPTPPPDSA
jgi:hypothetical protein